MTKEKNEKNKLKEEQNNDTYNPNLTEEDVNALGKKGLRKDGGDDRMLQNRNEKIDFSGEGLDVPTPLKGQRKNKAVKDEENTLYGQGADKKTALETPRRANKRIKE
jgi:hypothetical protein